MARCPAHDDRTPSLSIRDADDGKVLVRCHAGCDQERVIAALRGLGLWADGGPRLLSRKVRRAPAEHKPDQDDAKRSEAALAIWESAKRAEGTLVEVYLASRGIRPAGPGRAALPSRPEAPLWRHLAGDGRAGDAWPGRQAAGNSSHLSGARRDRKGASRAAEDDARPMPWRCRAPRQARATC